MQKGYVKYKYLIRLEGVGAQLWQSLNHIFSCRNVHDRNTRYFTDTALKISIASSDDIALVLHNTLNQTVISICTLVRAGKSFEPRITSNSISRKVSNAKADRWYGRLIVSMNLL